MGSAEERELITERLVMRPYTAGDAESVFQVVRRREIAETTIMIPHPYPRETVDWWINFVGECRTKGTAFEFGLFEKDSSRYIGNCALLAVSREHHNAELGYFIDPERWNMGYGAEACKRIVRFGFEALGLERIYGRCLTRNPASRRVMEKAGLRFECIARHEVRKWDKFEDVVHLALIRSEWDEINADAGQGEMRMR